MPNVITSIRRGLGSNWPRVRVQTRPAFPGWLIRWVGAILPGAMLMIALARTGLYSYEQQATIDGIFGTGTVPSRSYFVVLMATFVAVGLGLTVLWRPTVWQPLIQTVFTGVLTVFVPPGPVTLALIAGCYLGVRACMWAESIPWGARVEFDAAKAMLRTDLMVVAVGLAVGALGLMVSGQMNWLILAPVVALAGLAWWVRAPKFSAAEEALVRQRVQARRDARANLQIERGRGDIDPQRKVAEPD